MIFYFSGTGNSRWVASKIAEKIEDKAYDIDNLDKIPKLDNEKQIGLIFPIYAWGVPEPMVTFVKKLKKVQVFTFAICTCGADAGKALKKLSNIYRLDRSYSIAMPSNYIIGGDLEDKATILKKIELASKEIERISKEIIEKKKIYRVNEGKLSMLKSSIANKGFNKFARDTSPFYVDKEKCTGCGLCAKMCPASTIKLIDGRPTWNKKCYQCLRCINNCPHAAIQYGDKTEKRGRYNINNYL